MKLTLPNGLTIEGDEHLVRNLAFALGHGNAFPREHDGVHYFSQSKQEWVRIKNMDTKHLIYAIRKIIRAHVEALPTTRIDLLRVLPLKLDERNPTLRALVTELNKRTD